MNITRGTVLGTALTVASAAVPAQVTGSTIALTPVAVSASGSAAMLPAGHALVAPGSTTGTSVFATNFNTVCPVTASSSGGVSIDPAGVALTFDNRASALGLWCPGGSVSCGPHSVLMTFDVAAATNGTLTIDTTAPVPGATSYVVDVGNDGSIELQSGGSTTPGHLELPLSASPGQPVVVRVDTSLVAFLNLGSAAMDVRVHYGEGTPLSSYGTRCDVFAGIQGPEFAGVRIATPTGLEYRFFGRSYRVGSSVVHFYVFGVTSLNVPIPPSGCTLLNSIEVALPITLDVFARSSLSVAVPAGLGPAPLHAQYIQATVGGSGPPRWYTSVGLDWSLP